MEIPAIFVEALRERYGANGFSDAECVLVNGSAQVFENTFWVADGTMSKLSSTYINGKLISAYAYVFKPRLGNNGSDEAAVLSECRLLAEYWSARKTLRYFHPAIKALSIDDIRVEDIEI